MVSEELVEKVALTLKAKIGAQFDAVPLLGDTASDDWAATGGVLDLTELARAALAVAVPIIAADAIAKEREACAKDVEGFDDASPRMIAYAIRSRQP